ncbi:hypothetical protein EYR40_010230 [Pleurotus pulmonarius]|nr:hypothetical protein EYR36_010378 [Pleurotus pulmonarius]KAF4586222.1 hypothetical protein EYR38_010496 [Pleurotus pulmonarius]KAF4588677.1 hypothetical protein EYR40_010230 [Pleurotus pulmonarius]
MRASAAHYLRIVPRSSLRVKPSAITPAPAPQVAELQQPTIIDILTKRRDAAGSRWPQNLRIEPVLKREALQNVRAEVRSDLKALLRER